MALTSRNVPRFLPTLTEVVHAPALLASPMQAEEASAPAVAEQIAIVESVRGQVEGEMGELLRDAVATALLEQVDTIAARLRSEMEPMLRQAVADMVAHEIAARRRT